jgi:uncharacterized protein (TIGR00297 family)
VPLGLAAIVSALAALAAWWARTLTTPGAIAAWVIGVVILHRTGWQGGAVLAAFFISSNLISRIGPRTPAALDPKSDRRDAWQVLANGGAAAVGAALTSDSSLGIWIVTAALAAAAADTWATSVGVLSRVPPRLLGSGRVVPAGTSGGMTVVGSAAGAAGGVLMATCGTLASGMPLLLPIGTLIGFLGMVVDSMLGALLQGRFQCPRCTEASEWRVHRCGASTIRMGGLAWLNNDGVNFIATAAAAASAVAVWRWLSPS